jgi:hypothetical protein
MHRVLQQPRLPTVGRCLAKDEFATLDYKHHFNPRLPLIRDDFVAFKIDENDRETPYSKQTVDLRSPGGSAGVSILGS